LAGDGGVSPEPPSKLAFLYGAREVLWPGIVQSLLAEGGAVRAKLLECEGVVRAKLGWSLQQMSPSDHHTPEHVLEPLLTSVQIALTEGWREFGVEPDVVGGRCVGVFAAAHAAGRLSLDQALEMACRVSRLFLEQGGGGGLMWLNMGVPDVEALLRVSPVPFAIASDAEDRTTVIAYGEGELGPLEAFLTSQNTQFRKVGSTMALHHPAMDRWAPAFCAPLETSHASASVLPVYCATATGSLDETADDGRRFWRAIRDPALVGPMARAMLNDGCRTFLEVGGYPSMRGLIGDEAQGAGCEVRMLASMRRCESFSSVSPEARGVLAQLGRCALRVNNTAVTDA